MELSNVESGSGPYARELSVAVETALEAGAAVRALYDAASAATYIKGDGSPVTDADLASDRIIRERIGAAFPDDAILTEEGADDESRLAMSRCWVVDPIDGTQQFIDRTGEFEVIIALVVDGRPEVGVIYQPTGDLALIATAGGGAYLRRGDVVEPVRFRPVPAGAAPRVFASVYFGAPDALPTMARICARLGADAPGVSSCGVTTRGLLPESSRFDALLGLYVPERDHIAWEWDFAAADLFVHEAGGRFTNLRGELHRYNKPGARNAGGLLISVDPVTHERLVEAVAPELAEPVGTP
jgi:3'-phosphoadenosine 5'-phosphosulfate (PAPS) 3'-phosphatase